jgi:hypothetical protein
MSTAISAGSCLQLLTITQQPLTTTPEYGPAPIGSGRGVSVTSFSGSAPCRPASTRLVERFVTDRAVGEFFSPAEQIWVRDLGDGRADERCQPEHPQLRGRVVAIEERHPRRPRRVDRRVGDRDGDQVDPGEGEADGQTGESLGRPVIGGSPEGIFRSRFYARRSTVTSFSVPDGRVAEEAGWPARLECRRPMRMTLK